MPPQFFEGTEKKVELAVVPGHASLRGLGSDRWAEVVAASGAQVLSRIENERVEAYLLSESSLFVHDDRVTMITCGRTRLVASVEALLRLVDPGAVASLVYERTAEHFPEQQPTSFAEDAARLATLVPGRAHRFGTAPDHHVQMFVTSRPFAPEPSDTTVEVLMHGIPRERAAPFRAVRPPEGGTLASATGLDRLLPGFSVDERCFTPAGYSLNAIRGGTYYTIHVTPEELGSYVSFETNHDREEELEPLVARVAHAFAPSSFEVVRFAAGPRAPLATPAGYRAEERVEGEAGGYHVDFACCRADVPSTR